MSTIENNFALATARVSSGFDSSILGQANRINTLQNNGIAAAGGGAGGVSLAGNGTYMPGDQPALSMPRSLEQGLAMLRQNPALMPQALQALQDPRVLRQVLGELQQKPELIQALPPQIQQFLHSVLSAAAGM